MSGAAGLGTVLTNWVALPVAFKAYYSGHGIVPLLLFGEWIFSSSYHACDEWSLCWLRYQLHHDLDFFFAYSLISIQAQYLIHWVSLDFDVVKPVGVPFLQTALIGFLLTVNGILVAATGSALWVQFVIFLLAFGIVGLYLAAYRVRYGEYPPYNIIALMPAVILVATSVMLFSYQNRRPRQYRLVHSLWHATGLCSAWYFLDVMPAYPAELNIGKEVPINAGIASSAWATVVRKAIKFT